VMSKDPSLTPAQVKSSLIANAIPQHQPCDGSSKGGLAALGNAKSTEPILYMAPY
jgi:hypothetical protein